jgi:hypothetical protein
MNKEALIAAGLTEELAETVMGLHKTAIDAGYTTKDRFNVVSTENKQLKEQLTERDTQIEGLKTASGASDKLKQQITDLQAESRAKDADHAAELKRVKRDNLDERLLAEAKAINAIAAKPFLADIDDGVDDEGYTALRKQHIEALTKAESTKFLFETGDSGEQKFTGMKPGETGTSSPNNSVVNPFETKTYDVDLQAKMFRENPEQARALAKAAGVRML